MRYAGMADLGHGRKRGARPDPGSFTPESGLPTDCPSFLPLGPVERLFLAQLGLAENSVEVQLPGRVEVDRRSRGAISRHGHFSASSTIPFASAAGRWVRCIQCLKVLGCQCQ
jgi:hypothetical protein